jgi:tetratricopeptide (TPR) repeat protein
MRLKEAEESFHKAIQAGPLFYDAYYNLGLLYASQGKLEEAEKSLRKSLKIEPSYSWAWNSLGVVLSKKMILMVH